MEDFEKYLTKEGKILANNGKSVFKLIEGRKVKLLRKCLFLHILKVTEAAEIEELESLGLRDIIHYWFEAATATDDVYFLHILLDTFDSLPHSLTRDFNEQTRKLCNLNNPELTVKAKNLVMKWRKEDQLLIEKQKFTFITLDKSSSVKRINSQYRSLGDEDENITDTNISSTATTEEEPKTVVDEQPKIVSEDVLKVSTNEKVHLPMLPQLPDDIILDEDPTKIAQLSNKIKKTKKVSWASTANLSTIIPIEYGYDDETDSSDPQPSLSSNGLETVSSLSSSPTFDNTVSMSLDGNLNKKTHLITNEERKLFLSEKLFEIIVTNRNNDNIASLTCSDVYNILKCEQHTLKQTGLILLPPK